MRCILVGNYGVGNMGDEALKEYFLRSFPNIEWKVLSANPAALHECHRLPGGLRSFFKSPWFKTLRAIRQSDAMVFGGGSLFTDVESVYACFLWAMYVIVARLYGKPVLLASQGMGPYRTRIGKALARWAAHRAAFISVRDEASAERVSRWGLDKKIVRTFDPIFSFMISQKVDNKTKNVFTIIPRHNSGYGLMIVAAELLPKIQNVDSVQILLMQPDHPGEQGIAQQLIAMLPLHTEVVTIYTVQELMKAMSISSFVLTQRFHGALAALAASIPVDILPQGEGDKLWELKKFTGETAIDTAELAGLVAIGEESFHAALASIQKKKANVSSAQ